MPRTITVTFDDGSTHQYQNAPDDITPEQVTERAQKDFNKSVTHLDGGKSAPSQTNSDASNAAPTQQVSNTLSSPLASPVSSAIGAGETLAQIGSGLASSAVGGLAGLGTLATGGSVEDATKRIQDIQQAGTYQPRTAIGQQTAANTGSVMSSDWNPLNIGRVLNEKLGGSEALAQAGQPALATALSIGADVAGPAGLAKVAGLGIDAAKAVRSSLKSDVAPSESVWKAPDINSNISKESDTAQLTKKEDVIKAINNGDEEALKNMIDADPKFFTALDEMGISQEPLVSYSSRNPTIRAIEQGFAGRIGSEADVAHKNFMTELSNHAENLIEQYGGTKNTADLSQRFRNESINTIDEMGKQADDLYAKIGESVDRSAPADNSNISSYFDKQINENNGIKNLSPIERRVYALTQTKNKGMTTQVLGSNGLVRKISQEQLPTYSNLDTARKQVGQAIYQKSGPFKDGEVGMLKQLYANLSKDTESFADANGAGDLSVAAKALVSQRKRLENNLKVVMGKNLAGDLMPSVDTATKGLVGGNVEKFNRTIDSIPDAYKQEVVASALGGIFKGSGSGQSALGTNQFVKRWGSMDETQKNAIFKHLPPKARVDVENLYTVSKGIDTALKDKIPTGRVLQDFPNDSIGFFRKLAGGTASVAANLATRSASGGLVSAGDSVKNLILRSTNRADAAADLLASPKLKAAIRDHVKSQETNTIPKTENAPEQLLKNTKEYKSWMDTLDAKEKVNITSMGLMNYLMTNDHQGDEK